MVQGEHFPISRSYSREPRLTASNLGTYQVLGAGEECWLRLYTWLICG